MRNSDLTIVGGSLESLRLPKLAPTSEGQIGISELGSSLLVMSRGSILEVPFGLEQVDFFNHIFTSYVGYNSVSRAGTVAPTLENLISHYKTDWASDSSHFQVPTDGLGAQLFKLPASGRYRAVVEGASTASGSSGTKTNASNGAVVEVDFRATRDQWVEILCGNSGSWGGSGASYIRFHQGDLIALAGGAGGHGQQNPGTASLYRAADARAIFSIGVGAGGQGALASGGGWASGGAGWDVDGGIPSGIADGVGPSALSTPIGPRRRRGQGGNSGSVRAGTIGGGGGHPSYDMFGNAAFGGGGGYVGGNAAASTSSQGTADIAGQGGTCFAHPDVLSRSVRLRTIAESLTNVNGLVRLTYLGP